MTIGLVGRQYKTEVIAMQRPVLKKAIIFTLVINLLGIGFPQAAFAGLVGTEQLMDSSVRAVRVAQIERVLAREAVRDQFLKMGVSPELVQVRIAALTDQELQTLETQLNELPAGGSVLAVIGVVFVVLIILEVIGVTNIFSRM